MYRTYQELSQIDNFLDRFNYLKLNGKVAQETFGYDRYLNQIFYSSPEWKRTRRNIIARDMGLDLGMDGYPILGRVYVHHLNPITPQDIQDRSPLLFDPNNLICCAYDTHQAITFGSEDLIHKDPIERKPNDTCPWR